MFLHVRLQITYSHARTCTLFGSRWSARPWIVSVVIQAAIVDYYHYVYDSLIGWLRPYLSLFIWSSLDGCAHTLDLDYSVLCFGWLRPYHTYIMYLRCQLYFSAQVFRRRAFSWTCSRKAFHPSLSLGPHALGGICYTVICHHTCNPHLTHWRVVSVKNK